jgi:hypothetical protein
MRRAAQRCGAAAQHVVGALNGSVPKRHHAIADEFVDGAAFLRDRR